MKQKIITLESQISSLESIIEEAKISNAESVKLHDNDMSIKADIIEGLRNEISELNTALEEKEAQFSKEREASQSLGKDAVVFY